MNQKPCKYGHISERYKSGNCVECIHVANKKKAELKRLTSSKKPNGYWTKERCLSEALLYKQKRHFEIYSGSAYIISMKNKWLDEICSHMVSPQKPKNYWNLDLCFSEALKYKTRSDFFKNNGYAYNFLNKRWLINSACLHMERGFPDNDVIYIWETSETYHSKKVYKVGVTSNRLGLKRINQCAIGMGTECKNIVAYIRTNNARVIEKELLKTGEKYTKIKGDGYSELRCFDSIELNQSLLVAYELS